MDSDTPWTLRIVVLLRTRRNGGRESERRQRKIEKGIRHRTRAQDIFEIYACSQSRTGSSLYNYNFIPPLFTHVVPKHNSIQFVNCILLFAALFYVKCAWDENAMIRRNKKVCALLGRVETYSSSSTLQVDKGAWWLKWENIRQNALWFRSIGQGYKYSPEFVSPMLHDLKHLRQQQKKRRHTHIHDCSLYMWH